MSDQKIITDSDEIEVRKDELGVTEKEAEAYEQTANKHSRQRLPYVQALDAIIAIDGYVTVSKVQDLAGVTWEPASNAVNDKIKRGELEVIGKYNNGDLGNPSTVYEKI